MDVVFMAVKLLHIMHRLMYAHFIGRVEICSVSVYSLDIPWHGKLWEPIGRVCEVIFKSNHSGIN